MKNHIKEKRQRAKRRANRARARLHGTAERPRLTVKRSLKHIYAQFIDDNAGKTLVAASDMGMENKGTPMERAAEVGLLLAKKAKDAGIKQMLVDRGPYRYHGRVKALIEAVEEGGVSKTTN